jgi:hypothetical protein
LKALIMHIDFTGLARAQVSAATLALSKQALGGEPASQNAKNSSVGKASDRLHGTPQLAVCCLAAAARSLSRNQVAVAAAKGLNFAPW